MYVIAAVEALPPALEGRAHEIYINFPWGSLLEGLLLGAGQTLDNLARLAAPGAALHVLINLSLYDPPPRRVQRLPALEPAYIDGPLRAAWARAGIMLEERELVGAEELRQWPSRWAKHLAAGREGRACRLRARVGRGETSQRPGAPTTSSR